MPEQVIILSGKVGSGKTTLAEQLVENFKLILFKTRSFLNSALKAFRLKEVPSRISASDSTSGRRARGCKKTFKLPPRRCPRLRLSARDLSRYNGRGMSRGSWHLTNKGSQSHLGLPHLSNSCSGRREGDLRLDVQ